MSIYQSLTSNISKLQSLKIDRESIKSLQAFLSDPKTVKRVNQSSINYIVSVQGSWTISLVTASLLSFFVITPPFNSVSQSQRLITKYKQELSETPLLVQNVSQQRERYELLEKNETQLEKFLLNSSRILFFPEVLRQSAIPHQVKLISFRPAEEDLNDEFMGADSMPYEEFQDDSFVGDQIPGDEIPEDVLMGDLDSELSIDESLGGLSDSPSNLKEITSINYSLQLEGDYLRVLSFLRDIQSYQSLISIQSARFASSSSGSLDGSATNSSSTGSVLLDLVIQIPTFEK